MTMDFIMKFSFFLLSTAAVLVAGATNAADLPAKKAAPAAATGCPTFGAGFFQIPGGDTCLQFSGYMRNTTSYDDGTKTSLNTAELRLITDVRSNSEMGVVRGFSRVNASAGGNVTSDRAYAQIGGLTAGAAGAFFDIAGSYGIGYGAGLGGDTGTGLKYSTTLGPVTVTAGIQNPSAGDNVSKDQDFIGGVSGSVGPATYQVVGASHKNNNGQGYAFAGQVSIPAGPASVSLYGGVSSGAIAYTGTVGTLTTDSDGTKAVDGAAVGTSVGFTAGNGTLYFDVGRVQVKNTTDTYYATSYGVGYDYSLVKNFHVIPEVYHTDETQGSTKSNVLYLRIQRDF